MRPSSKAQVEDTVVTWSVPSRAMRCGHAARAIAAPTADGPGARHRGEHARVGDARTAQRAANRPVEPLHQPGRTSPGVTTRSCAGASGSASAPVAVTSVWPSVAETLAEHAPAVGVELRQRVVEQQQRRHARPATASSSASASSSESTAMPLLALRPERPEVAVAGEDADLVEVRAEPGRAALEVAGEPVVEGRRGRAARAS